MSGIKIIKSRVFQWIKEHMPDDVFIKWQYEKETGRKLDWNNPRTFNEKIQWLKLNWRPEIYTRCADKYEVRKFVKDVVGEEILIKLYGVYDRAEDIDLDVLPKSFVMKATNGWQKNIICVDKKDLDREELVKDLKTFLNHRHYLAGREWAYKNIVPRIICEEYLEEDGKSPKDYKIFCFNGAPRFIQVDSDRFEGHKRNFFGLDWQPLVFGTVFSSVDVVEKPMRLAEMIEYAAKLSRGFPFVRVDLYHVNNRIYFGELTFYPANGFSKFNPEADRLIGSYLRLPLKTEAPVKIMF